MENEKNQNQLTIEIRPEIACGSYSNFALISHSHSEFLMDFITVMPGLPKASVNNRIIMTPENAKRLLAALTDNMAKYEAEYGPVDMGQPKSRQDDKTFNLGDLAAFSNGTKS